MSIPAPVQEAATRLGLYNASVADVPYTLVGPDGWGHAEWHVQSMTDISVTANWLATTLDALDGASQDAINAAAQALGYRDAAGVYATSSAAVLVQVQALLGVAGTGPATTLLYPALDKILKTAADVKAVAIGKLVGEEYRAVRRHEQRTSWYNETLNTATRGARRRFPKRYAVVVQGNTVTIYDLTDLDVSGIPKMWMVFNGSGSNQAIIGSGTNLTSVVALGSRIYVGSSSAVSNGLSVIDFIADSAQALTEFAQASTWRSVAGRNVAAPGLAASPQLVARTIAGVAARCLPGAPTDVYGRKVPTVVAATDAGFSVIHPDGRVADVTTASGYVSIAFLDDQTIGACRAASIIVGPVPYADAIESAWRFVIENASAKPPLLAVQKISSNASASSSGLNLHRRSMAKLAEGMSSLISKDYATGWMVGNTLLAACCDAATGSLVGTSVADRSGAANDLTVNGTITRTAISGSDAVAYAGFSAANYMGRAYDADFDIGTGDFHYSAWVLNNAPAGSRTVFERGSASHYVLLSCSGSKWRFTCSDGSSVQVASVSDIPSSQWQLLEAVRRNGLSELWINGVLEASVANTKDLSDPDATLKIGVNNALTQPLDGSVFAFRFSKTAPTPAQIRRRYRDELARISGNGLLGGTSNSVTALAEDETSGKLVVGTGDGVSVFHGLNRIAYLDTTSSTLTNDAMVAVAANDDILVLAGGAQAIAKRDAVIGLDEMVDDSDAVSQLFTGVSTSATPVNLAPRIHVAEGETYEVEGHLVGVEYGTGTTKANYRLVGFFSRAAGGNVTSHITGGSQQFSVYESNAALDATLLVDTASQTIYAQVTGLAATTIAWTFAINKITRLDTDGRNAA